MANLANDYGYGQIAIYWIWHGCATYWIWHGCAILRSKRVDFHGCDTTIVETDAYEYALGVVLSQVNDSGKHQITFDSRKLLPAELNYEIHDKELLGIVWALKQWRAFLLSLSDSFQFLTDHSSIQHFMSSKVLTCCQARWADFLCEFHFSITYRPGRLENLPHALLHRVDVYLERVVEFVSKNPQNVHQFLNKNDIKESSFFSIKVEVFSDLVDQIQKAVWQDK
ncbi:hypothetical protein O181_043005 [Austropuccinia psidii MF-1]|uniref:Reverse transcriptase RNase H-like domain-containing protein n=1 Tax=Austropuccinia psidii MF-1 TaxID=1389203 RepID=A0A9Q3HIR0_9BASI|nr:hypothetical protein [Austropuccinia psidii MF-1]